MRRFETGEIKDERWNWRGFFRWRTPWTIWEGKGEEKSSQVKLAHRLPLICIFVLLLLQIFMPGRVWLAGLGSLGGLLVVAYVWAWRLARGLHGERGLRFDVVQVGDTIEERFELINRSLAPALWVEIVEKSDLPGYAPSTVRAVSGYGRTNWRSSGICERRGLFGLGPWELRTADPFGLFQVRQRYSARRTVLIYPPITDVPPDLVLPQGRTVGQTHSHRQGWEPTLSAATVRDYVPGDPTHLIHWRSTARQNRLQTKEMEQETAGEVWLILDLEQSVQAGEGIESTQEYGVILAASLAAQLLRRGVPVGLWTYGPDRRILAPSSGRAQLWELLRLLAPAERGTHSLHAILSEALYTIPTQATALLVTPSTRATWIDPMLRLRRRGIGVAAMFLDRLSFSQTPLETTSSTALDNLRAVLVGQGIASQVIRRGDLGELRSLDGRPRSNWEFKTIPTGHVVTARRPRGARV